MAHTKTIQSQINKSWNCGKNLFCSSSSKTVVTQNKVAFSSNWMLLEGLWTMEIALKLRFQFRIRRNKLKGKTTENLMVLRKNQPSKEDVKTKVHLWIHTSKQNNKGAWANVPCKSIFVSYFSYDHFWPRVMAHAVQEIAF